MSSSSINLLQRNAGPVREITELEDKLHLASLWALGILIGSGIIIGAAFLFLTSTVKSLETSKIDLGRQINQQSDKEGILLALKDRTGIAGKALASAKSWGDLFPLLSRIADGGFVSVSADENGRVTTELTVNSVDEAATIVSNMISLTGDKALKAAQLTSFVISEDGGIRLSLSFIPVL